MSYIILDTKFNPIRNVDKFESMIWTIRAREAGEFELYTDDNISLYNDAALNNYIISSDFYDKTSNEAHLMIIESKEISSDLENGGKIKITGRSLKSILSRRIVWQKLTFEKGEGIPTIIQTILNDNVINPQDIVIEDTVYNSETEEFKKDVTVVYGADRIIPNFIFEYPSGEWPTLKEDVSYETNDILEVINGLASDYNFNWEVVFNLSNDTFICRLLPNIDHSIDQNTNPIIVFSTNNDNLSETNHITSVSNEKNVNLVHGESDEYNRKVVIIGQATGLDRKEGFISGSSIQSTEEDGTGHGVDTYKTLLRDYAMKEIKKSYSIVENFEGEIDMTLEQYTYGVDYNLGDICNIINEYGIDSKVYISEIVLSENTEGKQNSTTFTVWNKDETLNYLEYDAGSYESAQTKENTEAIEQLKTNVDNVETNITDVSDTVESQGNDISTLIKSVNNQEDNINLIRNTLTSHENSIQTINNNITQLGSAINLNTSKISELNTSVDNIENDITELQTNKQNKLIAGTNITLVENADGTVTINSTGGSGHSGSYAEQYTDIHAEHATVTISAVGEVTG